jgi:hypothetical protein
LKRKDVVELNRLIVQCAEDLVFYRDDRNWIRDFVAKNKNYHVEPVTQTLAYGTGEAIVSTHRIVARKNASDAT